MSVESKKEIQLEIAHVLFIDIVGYSKLSISDQHAAVEELTRIVRASEQFQRAEAASRLIRIPTGDGMALVFYTSPEAPAQDRKSVVEFRRVLFRSRKRSNSKSPMFCSSTLLATQSFRLATSTRRLRN